MNRTIVTIVVECPFLSKVRVVKRCEAIVATAQRIFIREK